VTAPGRGEVGSPGFRPSERLASLPDYPLADAPAIRERLRREGRKVLDLGAGDPGLPVPEAAVEALRRTAGDPDYHGYPYQRGLEELRIAVSDWMEERFGRRPDPAREVLPLIGSKEGVGHLALGLLDPGDRVLAPDPGYAAYLGGSRFAGARVERAVLEPSDGFRMSPDRVRQAGDRLRLVYLNYPNNPTGATVDRGYLEEVARACRDRGAVLALDNPYSEVFYEGRRPPGLLELGETTGAAVEFHSFSKGFNMTGWRLGWACGDPGVLDALGRVKSFFDTGAFLPVQAAGAAALRTAGDFLPRNRRRLQERRDAAVSALRGAGFRVEPPDATLYLWIPVPGGASSEEFARRALAREAVLVMPGSALGEGGEGWFRVSLTREPDEYDEAARRLARAA
jgi:LL-diaminopimelate aminotransferase